MKEKGIHPMPDRRLRALREPPTVIDRLLNHPEISLAACSVLTGTILLSVAADWITTSNLSRLPVAMLIIMALFQLLGGAAVGFGLLSTHRRRDVVWQVERTGWWLTTTAWLAYSVAAAAFGNHTPASLIGPALGACFASGGIIRLIALYWIEKSARATIEKTAP